jgi:hypothetical protein
LLFNPGSNGFVSAVMSRRVDFIEHWAFLVINTAEDTLDSKGSCANPLSVLLAYVGHSLTEDIDGTIVALSVD